MRQKSVHPESPSERIVKNIRRATRKRHSSEEKIRIVLDGLRGESSIAELCRREGIAQNLYYRWSKDFLEAGEVPGLAIRLGLPPRTRSTICVARPWRSAFTVPNPLLPLLHGRRRVRELEPVRESSRLARCGGFTRRHLLYDRCFMTVP